MLPILVLMFWTTTLYGQAFFKSSNGSYRTNYFLSLKNESATLYGWELTLEKDTVYFKASGHLDTARYSSDGAPRIDISSKLDDYRFSKTRPKESQLNYFLFDKEDAVPPSLLYKYLRIKENNGIVVKVIMLKDSYDGRFDEFTFTRIK